MQSIKETAANIAASARSGMEKTKATVQEKMERRSADSPAEKDMATGTKEARINQAEANKQAEMHENAAAKEASGGRGGGSYSYSTTGKEGQATGGHQMSALPGHGSGEPAGQVTEGTVKSHPIGKATGTGGTAAHNTHVGAGTNQSYGTGGAYSG